MVGILPTCLYGFSLIHLLNEDLFFAFPELHCVSTTEVLRPHLWLLGLRQETDALTQYRTCRTGLLDSAELPRYLLGQPGFGPSLA